MATNDYYPAKFLDAIDNAFYFEVAETADDNTLDEDSFRKSGDCHQYWIQSKDNKVLLFNDDGQFMAQNLTTQQQSQCDCKFSFQIYNDGQQGSTPGKSVMLYIDKDGQKMVACCSDNREISSEVMDLPPQIEETAHKAVFYLRRLATTNNYMLESSLYPTRYLGLEYNGDINGVKKLVLRHKGKDEVDESCQFRLFK